QQTVIHEDAREAVADRTMNQCRGDRAVHAARQPADDAGVGPDYLAYPCDLALDEVAGGPVGLAAAHSEDEVAQQLAAPRRVRHLGMELHAEQRKPLMLDCRDRRVLAPRYDGVPGRWRVDVVA